MTNGGGITIREAKIVQLAADIGRKAADLSFVAHQELINRFILAYHPDKACEYNFACLRDGRCPMSPNCGGLM